MKPKVLIAEKVHQVLISQLEKMGFECNISSSINQVEMLAIIENYDGIIVRGKLELDKVFFEKAKKIKFIGRPGSGLENINLTLAKKNGILVLNSPEGNAIAVAEHTLAMLLQMIKNVHKSNLEMRNFLFEREANRSGELSGKTIAIIGYGNTGKAFEKLLSGFEVEILKYDINESVLAKNEQSTLDEIADRADIISYHVSLTESAVNMFSSHFINKLQRKPIIINTSRGKVVLLQNLLNAFQSNKISGACIDVFENEQFELLNEAEQQILKSLMQKNVIFTPHIAGWTYEALYKMSKILGDRIYEALKKDIK